MEKINEKLMTVNGGSLSFYLVLLLLIHWHKM